MHNKKINNHVLGFVRFALVRLRSGLVDWVAVSDICYLFWEVFRSLFLQNVFDGCQNL